jgi:HEAT repeat protein
LRSRLRDPLAAVHNRALIVATIGGFGPAARSAVPSLIDLLNAPDVMVRRSAAMALRKIGLDARLAGPSLVQRLKDPDPEMRKLALEALKIIDPESAMKADEYWRLK